MTEFIHAETKGAPDAPLVVTFHGTGGDEHQFHALAGQLVPGAHVISPRGRVLEQGMPRYFRRLREGVYDMVDLARDGVDVAIRFGVGLDEGLVSVPVRQEWLTPVMTPAMAARYPTPDTLRDAPLIHDDSMDFLRPATDWAAWFRAAGVAGSPHTGTRFSNADHAVDAAAAGMGVALARRSMIIQDLAEGRLVAPYPLAIEAPARFRFLCLPGTEDRPQIAAFREWFLAEIAKTAHISDQFTIIPVKDIPPP